MLYTGLKGTAGAYMATLLVLLSAFAATGAEKTPTTGADPQALPIKASTKKKSEIIKESPVDTKKTLSSTSDFKVANIVILNNTGLPDSDIYFNLFNTAAPNTLNCPPIADWSNLFQWYGGTVGTPGTPAKGIARNGPSTSHALSYNDSSWSGVSLEAMRGSVLSNASSTTNTPTSSSQWWSEQTYSSLNLNNYPTTDTTVKGQFPTISMGLFGACSPNADSAGRIAISAKTLYTGDNFVPGQPVSPYLLIEGMIFPTDLSSTYPTKASNLDISYVEQISIAADMELWTESNGIFKPQDNGWLSGYSVKTAEDATYNIFANAPASDGIQQVVYDATDGNKYNLTYAFTKLMVPVTDFKNPYKTFLDTLIRDTTDSLNSPTPTPHPEVKVAGINVNIGFAHPDTQLLEFGDCSYGNMLGYDFSTYFVDLKTTTSTQSQANWTKILSWYQTGRTALTSIPSDPTPYISCDGNSEHMIMLGTFSSGSSSPWSLSPNPANSVVSGPGAGPLSIQISNYAKIGICGVPSQGPGTPVSCVASDGVSKIQSMGLAAGNSIGGIFGTTAPGTADTTVNIPLGINFHVTDQTYLLKEFDLSVGKTEPGAGYLWVTLTNATTNAGLVEVSIIIPTQNQEGFASSVIDDNGKYTSGFTTVGGWPLQIDWEKRTCTYHGSPCHTTFYYLPTGSRTNWTEVTDSNLPFYNANRALSGVTATTPDTYRIDLNGQNLTVALTNGTPVGTAGTPIVSGKSGDTTQTHIYHSNGADYTQITSAGNKYLLNQIQISPAPTEATTSLHLLTVTKDDLLAQTGLAGNNPKYRFLRWNTSPPTPRWEEAFGSGKSIDPYDVYWPLAVTTSGSVGLCHPPNNDTDPTNPSFTVGSPPNSPSTTPLTATNTTSGIINTISGHCLGDISAAFSFGMVNSSKLGSDFTSTKWPDAPFPSQSTAIGALTTTQYFQLLGTQPKNDGTLPIGKNLNTKSYLTYDPYVSLGLNDAKSNCYFSGFGDRCSSYGGFLNVNPTFLIDSTPTFPQLNLGNVPGDIINNNVIVITLHPILSPPPPPIDSDLDDDMDTDIADMSMMLLAFGECPPAPQTCPEDLNKDGVVDNGDFGLLLINFTN